MATSDLSTCQTVCKWKCRMEINTSKKWTHGIPFFKGIFLGLHWQDSWRGGIHTYADMQHKYAGRTWTLGHFSEDTASVKGCTLYQLSYWGALRGISLICWMYWGRNQEHIHLSWLNCIHLEGERLMMCVVSMEKSTSVRNWSVWSEWERTKGPEAGGEKDQPSGLYCSLYH